jgi:ubiquinol-cytochrome c reductase cytochrome c1 subunit
MAKDVAAFLTWTAEPSLVKRTQTGWAVLGLPAVRDDLAWLAKQQVWAAREAQAARGVEPRRYQGADPHDPGLSGGGISSAISPR